MVQAKRIEGRPPAEARADRPETSAFEPGGEVGALQQELARRLLVAPDEPLLDEEVSSAERLIRGVSVGAGYASLLAGVVVVAVVLL